MQFVRLVLWMTYNEPSVMQPILGETAMRVRMTLDVPAPRGRMTADLATKLRATALAPAGRT